MNDRRIPDGASPTVPEGLWLPDDFLLQVEDGWYLQLFLFNGPSILRPLSLFFPSACEKLYEASLEHKRLRHALVALSINFSAPGQVNRYLLWFQQSHEETDESDNEIFTVYIVFTLTLQQYIVSAKHLIQLRRHLKRLYILLRKAQNNVNRRRRPPLSPLLLYIWRQIMRINVTFAIGVTHFPAVFPPAAVHPNGKVAHGHGAVRQYLDTRSTEDWTMAQLELDDIGNRIYRLHLRASVLRSNGHSDIGERELVLNTKQLIALNDKWTSNPVIRKAEEREQRFKEQLCATPDPCSFLGYHALRFQDPLYACLLLTHYSIKIASSLILDPRVGPHSPDRVSSAVQICRIFSALGDDPPVGALTCLAAIWWAGLVFDENHHSGMLVWKWG
jgi:hypothetical protein